MVKYLISLIESADFTVGAKQSPGLSTLIIGSGFGGFSIETCIKAILQGVINSNRKIREAYGQRSLPVQTLEFIELYQDNALTCMKILKFLEGSAQDKNIPIRRGGPGLMEKMGRRGRIPMESTAEWWSRITIRKVDGAEHFSDNVRGNLLFNISTDAARITEARLMTIGKEITELVESASSKDRWSPELAKTLFELLIPNDFKSTVKLLRNTILQVDDLTASFPWELLQDSLSGGLPLCVNSGLIRQLATGDIRTHVNSTVSDLALVIADPDLLNSFMQLPAARAEGSKVADLLMNKGYEVYSIFHGRVADILVKLYSQNYKVLHLAGHGVFEFGERKLTGMLIGEDIFLTSAHIDQMSIVPEMVFVNCCFWGQANFASEEFTQNRYKLAANLGTQLIQIGVKAVLVAGWAVNDRAALIFAEHFYEAMLGGRTFGEAVRDSRRAVFENFKNSTNTWGAYQCYGDPFYRLTTTRALDAFEYDFEFPTLAEIELTNLKNELDLSGDTSKVILRLNAINFALKRENLSSPAIIELLAGIYSALGMYEEAIPYFQKLLTISNATYTVKAVEQYCNVRVKYLNESVQKSKITVAHASRELRVVAHELKILVHFGATSERLNLLGSTYKRLGLLSENNQKLIAYEKAFQAYERAFDLSDPSRRYYPLINWVTIENVLLLKKLNEKSKNSSDEKKSADKMASHFKILLSEEIHRRALQPDNHINFGDLVAEADLKLTQFLVDPSTSYIEELTMLYQNILTYAGTKANRLGIAEHLALVKDLYGLFDKNDERAAGLENLYGIVKASL